MDHALELTAEQRFAVDYAKNSVEAKIARTLTLIREMPAGVSTDHYVVTTIGLMGDGEEDQESVVMMLAIQFLAMRLIALEAKLARTAARN